MYSSSEVNQLPDARLVIKALERTPAALESLDEGNRRDHAIGAAALHIVNSMPEKKTLNDYGVEIIAALPDYIEANQGLARLRQSEYTTRAQKEKLLKKIIPYNHLLRSMIDHNPRLSLSAVVDYVADSALMTTNPEKAKLAAQATRTDLEGMRHEIALEGVLYNIDGVEEVTNADLAEDMSGTDLIVNYKGTSIHLDVKSSMKNAQSKAYDKKDFARQHPTIPVWSGFTSQDFGDSLRITDQKAIQHRAIFVGELLEQAHQHGSKNALDMVLYDGNDTRISR